LNCQPPDFISACKETTKKKVKKKAMKNFFKPKKTFLTPQHKALDVMGLLDYTKKWQKGGNTGCGLSRFTDNDHQCHI